MDGKVEFPSRIERALRKIAADPMMGEPLRTMRARRDEFSSPAAANIAGAAAHPVARRVLDEALDQVFADETLPATKSFPEVVIGAGFHAAVYCAVRSQRRGVRPVVIEASERVGGAFAVSREPSFYLNSRNRPGDLGLPGEDNMTALNVLPGGVVQPSDLSGAEYQRNNDLALAIRTTLACHAEVLVGRRVLAVRRGGAIRNFMLTMSDGGQIYADRVILATGLGTPTKLAYSGDRIIDYFEFMASMDKPFPMRGMKRVAVLGAGDSGKTVIEALCGQGPSTGMSVSSLDWVERVDWYGAKFIDCESFRDNNRSRYKGIAPLLPRVIRNTDGAPLRDADETIMKDEAGARVVAIRTQAGAVSPGFNCAYVNDKPYDWVINCTGFNPNEEMRIDLPYKAQSGRVILGGREVAKRVGEDGLFLIGPRADIVVSNYESAEGVNVVPENTNALFRYAGRTAAFAASLS